MVAVDVMASLALLDWRDEISSFQSKWLYKHPLVSIHFKPAPPAIYAPNHIVIWGLNLALDQFIIENNFVESDIDLLYGSHKFGTISFLSILSLPANYSHQNGDIAGGPSSVIEPGSLDVTGQSQCVINLLPEARTLDRRSVFLVIYSTLRTLAFPDGTSICREPFQVGHPQGLDVIIHFTGSLGPSLPGKQQPKLQYRWIIHALRLASEDYLNLGLKEVQIDIYVENILVGQGFVEKAWRNALPLPSTQVSSS